MQVRSLKDQIARSASSLPLRLNISRNRSQDTTENKIRSTVVVEYPFLAQPSIPLDRRAPVLEKLLHLSVVREIVGQGQSKADPLLGKRRLVPVVQVQAVVERRGDEPLQLDGREGSPKLEFGRCQCVGAPRVVRRDMAYLGFLLDRLTDIFHHGN